MKGQTVVIVGGASGLGLTTAKLNGQLTVPSKIGLIDKDQKLLSEVSALVGQAGAEVAIATADISAKRSAHTALSRYRSSSAALPQL